MSLTSNPFHILGAKMTDDRRRIVALAKEKSFGGDEEAVRKAQSILLTPRKRLAAEIAWLPGVEPERIGELLWGLHSSASWRAAAAWATGWNTPSLAGANLLAHMGHYVDDGSLAWWVSLLAAAQRRVQADEVTALVNEARVAAGLPRASKQDVTEELRDRANSYRDTIERCLDTLETQRMAVVVTSVVNTATRKGTTHASALVDTLIDSYYDRRVSGTMDERRKGIANLAARVRADASGGRIARVPAIVGEIERALRAWDVLAQPIQVSLASRGMSHPPSDEIMRDTRNLAVFLINEHGVAFLEVAQSLTKTLRKVFAEMEPITELLDEDAATLDDIAAKVRTARPRTVREEAHRPGELDIAAKVRTARPRALYALLAAIGLVIFIINVIGHSPTPSTGGADTSPGAGGGRFGGGGGGGRFGDGGGGGRFGDGGRFRPSTGGADTSPGADQLFVRPAARSGEVLDTPQIRWCLREDIRIETWRPDARTTRQVDAFNLAVEDYNQRCVGFRYYEAQMSEARRDVTRLRSSIIADARLRAPW